MACISNTAVYGLYESIYRSGYPMMARAPDSGEFATGLSGIRCSLSLPDPTANPHIKRATLLAQAPGGGEDQFLTGIIVQMDVTASIKWWQQAERYKYLNFVSSMSTMHKSGDMDLVEMCNEYVTSESKAALQKAQDRYVKLKKFGAPDSVSPEVYAKLVERERTALLYNIPSGFELTAGMTTNYRCLKNVYAQRRHHFLKDWAVFCDWIETLPMADKLICCKNQEKTKI